MTPPYSPHRGDLIWLTFTPQSGYEQAGRRPALVVSPRSYNVKSGLVLLCLVTNQKKGYPFEVNLPEALPITGVVLADQVRSLDWNARHAAYICSVSETLVNEVVMKLKTLL